MTDSAKDNTQRKVRLVRAWHRSAVATAIVGGGFSVVVLAVMMTNYVQGRVYEMRWEKKLGNLKMELTANPEKEQALIEEIRLLDLEFRRLNLRRLDRARTGGYLLLGSVIVFVVGVKCAHSLRKESPNRAAGG